MRAKGLGAAALLVFSSCSVSTEEAPASASAFPPTDEIRAILEARVEAGFAKGVVVGLLEADGTTRTVAHGDAGAGRPLDGNTLFEIGSITKVFASSVLAQMSEEGLVNLDDPVEDYLPEGVTVPRRSGRSIRFIDLATHRSALPPWPTDLDFSDPGPYPPERLYEFLDGYELPRDIGASPEYSNVGVGLMGHALALMETDGNFEALLRERILDPLGLTSTRIELNAPLEERMAVGHGLDGEPAPPFNSEPTNPLAAAGSLRSSVNDLLAFLDANVGEPTSDLERAMRVTHQPRGALYEAAGLDVGLNWYITDMPEGRIIWHSGGTFGFRTLVGFDPDRAIGVVVLTNSAIPNEDIGLHLVNRSARLAVLPQDRPVVTVDRDLLERYVGTYPEFGTAFVITVGENGLEWAFPGMQPSELRAASESVFYSTERPDEFEFRTADDGSMRMIYRGAGMELPIERADPDSGGDT